MVAGFRDLVLYLALMVWLVHGGGIYRGWGFLFLCYCFGGGFVGGVTRQLFVCEWLWLVVWWSGGMVVGPADLMRWAAFLGWLLGGCPIFQGGVCLFWRVDCRFEGKASGCSSALVLCPVGGGRFVFAAVCLFCVLTRRFVLRVWPFGQHAVSRGGGSFSGGLTVASGGGLPIA